MAKVSVKSTCRLSHGSFVPSLSSAIQLVALGQPTLDIALIFYLKHRMVIGTVRQNHDILPILLNFVFFHGCSVTHFEGGPFS